MIMTNYQNHDGIRVRKVPLLKSSAIQFLQMRYNVPKVKIVKNSSLLLLCTDSNVQTKCTQHNQWWSQCKGKWLHLLVKAFEDSTVLKETLQGYTHQSSGPGLQYPYVHDAKVG